ncbi:class I SAM-dependent methyltransferase [Marinobacter sp. ATCH36]|uniref:class I SAM-dependent methyltransferase n=1 Tax=Marinobacter sp. ATCH36 TaxID=2945106 RepID=UPI002021E50B|nr:class I SAM-dependent methyltransferase [Marinobacter sp. ATCH36]MCL7944149.1 class I SAM-dependent methyltransferase [Marinobacter sp. ATCH36]
MTPYCPVCESHALVPFQTINATRYHRCTACEATVMDEADWLDEQEEKAIYDLHDNNPQDEGYRRFLSKLTNPLLERLRAGDRGLDFGCGPGPALAVMLREAGMDMALYDPFFCPDESVLEQQYDFITCTEVVEHLHRPAEVFRQLDRLMAAGSWLGVMTCFQTDDERFANWHYRRDPTHIVFYRRATLEWLAGAHGWTLDIPAKDVALFQKH